MAIGRGKIGVLAQDWVGNDGDPSIDDNDWASESDAPQGGTRLVDLVYHSTGRQRSTVDNLISNWNSVNWGPVIPNGCDQLSKLGFTLPHVENTKEDFHSERSGGSKNVGDLVAINAIDTDHAEAIAIYPSDIDYDDGSGLAGSVGIIRGIDNSRLAQSTGLNDTRTSWIRDNWGGACWSTSCRAGDGVAVLINVYYLSLASKELILTVVSFSCPYR